MAGTYTLHRRPPAVTGTSGGHRKSPGYRAITGHLESATISGYIVEPAVRRPALTGFRLAVVRIVGLVVHYELVVDKVEAVGARLVLMPDHLLHCFGPDVGKLVDVFASVS